MTSLKSVFQIMKAFKTTMNPLTYPDEVLSLSMFQPDIRSRQQAETFLLHKCKGQGAYIVRPNTENNPEYVSISVSMPGSTVIHIRAYIGIIGGAFTYHIVENKKFSTFNELLVNYKINCIYNKQGVKNLRLLTPITKEGGSTLKCDNVNMDGRNRDVPNCLDQQDPRRVMKDRPQAPLPRSNSASSRDSPYYSTPKSCKNFFTELYQSLKNNDRCECGLRQADSILPLGWSVHINRSDSSKLSRVFFQHGDTTAWDMPVDVVDKLSAGQIDFLAGLFSRNQQLVPKILARVLVPAVTFTKSSVLRTVSTPLPSSKRGSDI